MIVFILGTTAEAIKIKPVADRLSRRGTPFEIWATYQHTDSLVKSLASLELPAPSYTFSFGARGKQIERPSQMLAWLTTCMRSLMRDRRALRNRLGLNPLIVVHGDTVTTVFGAVAARVLRVPSAHIEAGLRSGSLFRPFPEELDRRIVGLLARVHFAPNEEAERTLRRRDVVNTEQNTAIDGVLDTLDSQTAAAPALTSPYGLVLLHRFEFISQPDFVRETVATLAENSRIPLIVLTDAFSGGPMNEAISEVKNGMVRTTQKLDYADFVRAMARAEFIFTDSGGIQQEAGLLGVPTMLHRKVTESPDGIGRNIVLSDWNLDRVREFLAGYTDLSAPVLRPERSPSDIIIDSLAERGFLS